MSLQMMDFDHIGRGIDEALRAGRFEDAASLCREILRASPSAVRPHCTLAWICIGKGRLSDAQAEVTAYVAAARASGDIDRAAAQLRMMADATFSPDLRRFLAEQLARAGWFQDAQRIMLEMHDDLAAARVPPEEQQRRIWRSVLENALRS